MRADWCAASVSGSFITACGLLSACLRKAIGTAASSSLVAP